MQKIWLKSYEKGVATEIDINECASLVQWLADSVAKHQDKIAFSNMGCTMSYLELDRLTLAFAAYLQVALGAKKGERLAVMLPNLLQYPVVMLGALRAGLVVVNVNPLYTAPELAHILQDSGAKYIVVLENFAHTFAEVKTHDPKIQCRAIVTKIGDLLGFKGYIINWVVRYIKKMVPAYHLDASCDLRSVLKNTLCFKPVELNHHDLAFLQYTGGTTGVAKGAMLTHGNMVANILQAKAWLKTLIDQNLQGGIITALPLYHIFSLTANCLTFLDIGVPNILITNPRDVKGFIKELKRQPFSVLTGVNTLFNALMNHPDFKTIDFSGFAFTLGGGMAVQQVVAEHWKAITGIPLLQAYGLTETSPAVTMNPLYMKNFNGSVGLPIPSTEVKICNEAGEEVGLDVAGELCVRGPQVMKGYWQDEAATKAVLDEAGWLKTGDIGMIDAQGFIRLVDRKKDLIIVSGFNVYPNEVEAVIASMPGIKEVGVVGVPHEDAGGERVKACVVLSDPKITVKDIIAFCKLQLTQYKIPKIIEFRDELPKTNVGKILRRALRDPKA